MAKEYYFPNYPYNDLREDPFLLDNNNAYNLECNTYVLTATKDAEFTYTDCFNNDVRGQQILAGETVEICSTTFPVVTPSDAGTPTPREYDTYELSVERPVLGTRFVHFSYQDVQGNYKTVYISVGTFTRSSKRKRTIQVFLDSTPEVINSNTSKYAIRQIGAYDEGNGLQNNIPCYPNQLKAFEEDASKYRHVFNSPETSFGQPFLGDVLKIEGVLFGRGIGHFAEVRNNALYKLLTKEAQEDALASSEAIASSGSFNSTAMFTAYQSYLQIYLNGITRKNYAWSYNSIASYDYYSEVKNGLGIKQRSLENSQYLFSGFQSVGEETLFNNFHRENSVYLRTNEEVDPLPFPNKTNSLLYGTKSRIEEESRFISSEVDCNNPEEEFPLSVVSYYGSIKNNIPNQWGQIYSYETIDTGFQAFFDSSPSEATFFGGDTFIGKFGFKTKLPFFIENRVGAPDDSDVFYDELGNVAYPAYWHSARSILYDYATTAGPVLKNVISIKAHNFDCPNSQLEDDSGDVPSGVTNPNRTYYDGKMYMFAYGIPYFYCESSINVDLRQAANDREGDFYPHVSTGIPDDWLQESRVPIAQDNTYIYNVSYSKQNKENFFSHLPVDWEDKLCYTHFPFRAIYSEKQQDFTDTRVNNWLIYRPLSYFDFPQNYGNLTSLDGIQNKAILARFENKSLLYNTLLTVDTSNPKAAYLGNDNLFESAPPVDFAETDLGYVGSQHKFILRIPQGQVSVDAKRGQIFLIQGNKANDISALGSGLSNFLNLHLPFEILSGFLDINIDNHFSSIGLHGVYDNTNNRVIISKLDYSPLRDDIKYDNIKGEFYIEEISPSPYRIKVNLKDTEYFCNKSWTLSYNLNTNTWISFHSYIPNWYIAENNFFYSGINEGCDLEVVAFEEGIPTTTTTSTRAPFECALEATIENFYTTTTTTTTSAPPLTTTTTTGAGPTTTTTSTTEGIGEPPAFLAKGQEDDSTSSTVVPICPTGIENGDLLFLVLASVDATGTPFTPPLGWNFVQEGYYFDQTLNMVGYAVVYYKIATTSDSGVGVSVNRGGNTGAGTLTCGQVYQFRASNNIIVDYSRAYDTGNGATSMVYPELTLSGSRRTLVAISCSNNSINVGSPSGYTQKAQDRMGSEFDYLFECATIEDVSTAPEVTATGGSSDGWCTFHIAIYNSL